MVYITYIGLISKLTRRSRIIIWIYGAWSEICNNLLFNNINIRDEISFQKKKKLTLKLQIIHLICYNWNYNKLNEIRIIYKQYEKKNYEFDAKTVTTTNANMRNMKKKVHINIRIFSTRPQCNSMTSRWNGMLNCNPDPINSSFSS